MFPKNSVLTLQTSCLPVSRITYHIVTDEIKVTFPQFLAFTSLSGTSQFQMKAYLWIRKQFLRQEGGFPEAERPDWTLFSTRCLPVTSQRHRNCGTAAMRERSSTRVLLAGAIACILSCKRSTHIFMADAGDSAIKAVGRKTNIFTVIGQVIFYVYPRGGLTRTDGKNSNYSVHLAASKCLIYSFQEGML